MNLALPVSTFVFPPTLVTRAPVAASVATPSAPPRALDRPPAASAHDRHAVRNTRLPVRVRRRDALGFPAGSGLHPQEGTRWRRGLAQTRRRPPPTSARSGTERLTGTATSLGSLLQLRGSTPSASPLVSVRGNVLAFSGEIFGGVAGAASGAENDAAALLAAFDEVFARAPDDGLPHPRSSPGCRARGLWRTGTRRPSACGSGRRIFGRAQPAPPARLLARPRRRRATRRLASRDGTRPVVRRAETLNPETDEWEELEPGLYCVDARRGREKKSGRSSPTRKKKKARSPSACARFAAAAATAPGERASTEDASARGETEDSDTEVNDEKNTARDRGGWVRGGVAAAVERLAVALSVPTRRAGNGTSDPPDGGSAFIGVLFSGGGQHAARGAGAQVRASGRAVDLINVCFDGAIAGPRRPCWTARLKNRAALPGAWRLVRVALAVADRRRRFGGVFPPRIAGLLRPARTVMDRNIGAALWLAARGKAGSMSRRRRRRRPLKLFAVASRGAAPAADGVDGVRIRTRRRARAARAGRGRAVRRVLAPPRRVPRRGVIRRGHMCVSKRRWACGGPLAGARLGEALGDAVRLDAARLWRRNMGRDDRLVSDRGREARFPFLDEGVAARLWRRLCATSRT